MSIENLPRNLIENRELIEGNFVLTLWNEPQLFADYTVSQDDLLLEESQLLYTLGLSMFKSGIMEFNQIAVETYLTNLKDTKEQLDTYGGVREVIKASKIQSPNNIERVYDDLAKANTIIALYKTQLDILKNIEKLKEMDSTEQIQDYVDYRLSDCVKSKHTSDVSELDGTITDDFIQKVIDGQLVETIQFNHFAPILSNKLNGSVLGKLHIVGGMSGAGKSTFMLSNILYPHLLQGESVCLITNELNHQEFLTMLTAVVACDVIKTWKLTRSKMTKRNADGSSKLTEEDVEVLFKVRDWVNENIASNFKFIDMKTTSFDTVKKMIKKYALQGCKTMLFDTFKSDNGNADGLAEWQVLIEHSKELTIMASKYNIAMYITTQLAPGMAEKRFLTRNALSQSKGIVFMAHSLILIRKIFPDEYSGEKNDIKPYRYEKSEITGKWMKKPIELDPDKKYILVFIDKNRSGDEGECIVYQFNGDNARYFEVGLCTVKVDSF